MKDCPQFAKDLHRLITLFIEHPALLEVNESWSNPHNCLLTIKAHGADTGKIIGQCARTICALQLIFKAYGTLKRRRRRVLVTLLEPDINTKRENIRGEFVPALDWGFTDDDELLALLAWLCNMAIPHPLVWIKTSDGQCTHFIVEALEKDLTNEIESAINAIFRAIGKCRGRRITINGRVTDKDRTLRPVQIPGAERLGPRPPVPDRPA